jgi:hypothetical protein
VLCVLALLACGAEREPERAGSEQASGQAAAPGQAAPAPVGSDEGAVVPVAAAAAGSAAPPAAEAEPRATDPGGAPQAEPPTGVSFDWPETDPGTAVQCMPGHYLGAFSCELRIIAEGGPAAFPLMGTIDLELRETADGELLRIANGTFVSAAAVAIPAWGDVVGELDCSTGRFEGELQNGKFSVALGIPVPFTEGTFMGPLSADYDAQTAELRGDWNMIGELDGFPGSCTGGTWSVQLVP